MRATSAAGTIMRADTGGPARDSAVSVGACSGVLVAPDKVLTAAHCVPPAFRQERPFGRTYAVCAALPGQARLQWRSWEEPGRWYPLAMPHTIRFGPSRDAPRLVRTARAYALPRCADMALLQLEAPVPDEVATPRPLLLSPSVQSQLYRPGRLRHAGWGRDLDRPAPSAVRGTGPVQLWGANRCSLAAMLPIRPDGRTHASGDSGAPLLVVTRQGEAVAGILSSVGIADQATCGRVHPAPPRGVFGYTPTYRGAIPGAPEATDIAQWLRAMVAWSTNDQDPSGEGAR